MKFQATLLEIPGTTDHFYTVVPCETIHDCLRCGREILEERFEGRLVIFWGPRDINPNFQVEIMCDRCGDALQAAHVANRE